MTGRRRCRAAPRGRRAAARLACPTLTSDFDAMVVRVPVEPAAASNWSAMLPAIFCLFGLRRISAYSVAPAGGVKVSSGRDAAHDHQEAVGDGRCHPRGLGSHPAGIRALPRGHAAGIADGVPPGGRAERNGHGSRGGQPPCVTDWLATGCRVEVDALPEGSVGERFDQRPAGRGNDGGRPQAPTRKRSFHRPRRARSASRRSARWSAFADAEEDATNLIAMFALVCAGVDCWPSVPTAMTRKYEVPCGAVASAYCEAVRSVAFRFRSIPFADADRVHVVSSQPGWRVVAPVEGGGGRCSDRCSKPNWHGCVDLGVGHRPAEGVGVGVGVPSLR